VIWGGSYFTRLDLVDEIMMGVLRRTGVAFRDAARNGSGHFARRPKKAPGSFATCFRGMVWGIFAPNFRIDFKVRTPRSIEETTTATITTTQTTTTI
jgi:hypothetical protein